MADTAAHLVDCVFPEVPVRQYVLSLPFALRYRIAFDQELCSELLRIFVQTVFTLSVLNIGPPRNYRAFPLAPLVQPLKILES
jgi:hypothetical protein